MITRDDGSLFELARGAMGITYKAFDTNLRHRHVASVFHLGTDAGAYFYAMEFIDGETVAATWSLFREKRRGGRLDVGPGRMRH